MRAGPGGGAGRCWGAGNKAQMLDLVEPTAHSRVDELPAATVTHDHRLVSPMKEPRAVADENFPASTDRS